MSTRWDQRVAVLEGKHGTKHGRPHFVITSGSYVLDDEAGKKEAQQRALTLNPAPPDCTEIFYVTFIKPKSEEAYA